MTDKKTRSIIIEHPDGGATLVEGIPANAKITFGPVQPGRGVYGDNVLRIYTSASNQLGVFRNVASFRDTELTVKVREVSVETDSTEYRGADGSSRTSGARVINGPFVEPQPQFGVGPFRQPELPHF